MQKKILIFSTAYLPFVGGAEIAIKEITDRIEDTRFDMITLRFDSRLPKFERLGNINIYRLGFAAKNPIMSDLVRWPLKLNKYLFPFLACLKACRLQGRNKYDGSWAMMAAFAGFAAMFFKICHKNVPYLLTLQEGDSFEDIKKKVRFVFPLFKKIFTKADFIQVISNYLAGFAREMGYQGELGVVPNGVDLRNYELRITNYGLRGKLGISDKEKVVITVSRLVKKNGLGDLIEAMRYLPANLKLLIIGGGELEPNLKFQIKNLKLDDRVVMLGAIDNKIIPEYLAASDIFIRPSLSEGQGIAFLEAMAAGVPVIATPVGGIVDFLKDGETGLFCEVRKPKDIAEKIKIYLENKELTEQIKVNARNMAEKDYSWELIAEKMKIIFSKLTD